MAFLAASHLCACRGVAASRPVVCVRARVGRQGGRAQGREHTEHWHKGTCQLAWCVWSSYSSLVPVPESRVWEAARRGRRGVEAWVAAGGPDGGGARWARGPLAVAGRRGRAVLWPAASLRAPHCGVDGRAGGQCDVQVGQQGAHVQGVGVPDEDLTEDRGIRGKQDALPGGGGWRRGGGGCPQLATKGRTRRERGAAPGEWLGGVGPRAGGPPLGATWRSGGRARPGRCCAAA